MSTIFVTGSTDGIGRQTALDLIRDGHRVVVHARNDQRAEQARLGESLYLATVRLVSAGDA